MANDAPRASRTAVDLLYDSAFSGAIAGAVVSLYFLVVDALSGQPLATPSLMGSVLFEGTPAEAVDEVRLDLVAYYSVVHLVAFGALGALISFLVYEVELHAQHPVVVLLATFVIFEVGSVGAASVLLPGVVARLGVVHMAAANLLAAAAMALFLLWSHDNTRRLSHPEPRN